MSIDPLPERPLAAPAPRRSIWTLILAGTVAFMFAVALVFMTLGFFGGVLAVGAAIFALAGLNYLVWGRWLSGVLAREAELERQREAADRPASQ